MNIPIWLRIGIGVGCLLALRATRVPFGPGFPPGMASGSDKTDYIGLLGDAEDYVNSVMSSQQVSAVLLTPPLCGRKRHLSLPSESEVKKIRTGDFDNEITYIESSQESRDRQTDNTSDDMARDKQQTRNKKIVKRNLLKNSETSNDNIDTSNGTNHKYRDIPDINLRKQNKRGRKSADSSPEHIMVRAEVHDNSDISVKDMMTKLADDMHQMYNMINQRMDSMEHKLEDTEKRITDKITDKLTKIVDRRINSESSRLRKDIDKRIETVKDEINHDIAELNDKVHEMTTSDYGSSSAQNGRHNIDLNIVIRELPMTQNENVLSKVEGLLKDGLKLRDVSVVAAERKESHLQSKPGVVIATMRNEADKKKVMESKQRLKESTRYRRVFIHHDQTMQERRSAANLRALVNAVRNGNTNITVVGTRVVDGGPGAVETREENQRRRNGNNTSTERQIGGAYTNKRDNRESNRSERGQNNYGSQMNAESTQRNSYTQRNNNNNFNKYRYNRDNDAYADNRRNRQY